MGAVRGCVFVVGGVAVGFLCVELKKCRNFAGCGEQMRILSEAVRCRPCRWVAGLPAAGCRILWRGCGGGGGDGVPTHG